ncbi:ATP-binding cassette domain-containing protein [Patescibacteria group bacterium]|nr:ATP-binding cassette domain-containing protein [Patescibacteria group bacterium]MBU1673108.1 ATP-binding cassette domain-containing protein [Patescibacteria group bacterium]MBU1963470.1 ATP-binding cassette domain-containing protein [Patescibacteria group bacterium]
MDLEVKEVSVKIDENLILDQISFVAEPGRVLAVMGPSGSGKTTLLKTIAGLLEFEGDVLLGDKNLKLVPTRKRNMGMVTQDLALFPHQTIWENISYPLKIRGLKIDERNKKTKNIIDKFGLPGLENKLPQEVSGGEQQRTAIARAMIYKPQALLLDEPFGQLDTILRYDLLEWLKKVLAEENMIVIFVTHNQREAKFIGDNILFINKGQAIFNGPFAELEKSENGLMKEFLRKDI